MSKPTELTFFDDAENDVLAALVMDLAAQLHIERQRRLALETVLTRARLIDPDAMAALADDQDFRSEAGASLDRSLARLIRIMTQHGDRTGPLRAEAPDVTKPAGMS